MLMEGWLSELEHESHIRRYQADGDTYLEIANFLKHQKIDKPTPSKLPKFAENSPKPTRTVAKNSLGREGIIGRDQGGEGDERASAPPPEKPIALIPDETPVTQEPYDPAADPFDSIPEGLTTVQYATEVFRDVGISPGYALKVKLADVIPILAREEACSDAEAVRRLRDRMREAQRAGPVKWNFWLEDGGWKLTQGNTLSIEGLEDGV
jgi:hypothetical protein